MENKYIPLYRKYRPQTFHDLIGQENIVHALSNAIKLNRIAHAYLLCGPRGTGKTSSARILAKSLNCKEGPTLNPCGKCPACLDIMNSIPVDVIEIDAASNRSVEDTQAILEKIQYVPVNGRYKIYVIDEVHMLSNHAFNALLKTLEEPPENVIFILATTEPHKVLDTIISRCQRFDFRRITTDDIVKRLTYISEQEKINISKDALFTIAKNSQGGMRDALALLDQISVLGINKEITVNDINELLGKISYDILFEITNYIIESDCSKSVELIDKIYSKGNEPVQIVSNLIQYFRDLMILKNCNDKNLIFSLTQINEVIFEKTLEQSKKFSVAEIIQIIDKLSYYSQQIKDTTNKYLWLEMCIIDLTNYKNLPSLDNLMQRIEKLENQLNSPDLQVKQVQNIQKTEIIKPKEVNKEENKVQEPVITEKNDIQKQTENKNETTDINKLWISILQCIESLTTKSFFSNLARPVTITPEKVVIAFPKEMFVNQAKDTKKQVLSDAISQYLNIPNPYIEFVVNENLDLSHKISKPITPVKKNDDEKTIIKQEEEEYHNFVEKQKQEENNPSLIQIDSSSQANIIKTLFNGKFID